MGYGYYRHPFHLRNGPRHLGVRVIVDGRCRLVHNNDLGGLEQSSG